MWTAKARRDDVFPDNLEGKEGEDETDTNEVFHEDDEDLDEDADDLDG